MSREFVSSNTPVFDQLHPRVHAAAIGLVAWFALSAWVLFDRQSDADLSLAMVCVLLVVAVLVPFLLSLVWKKYQGPHDPHVPSFQDWRKGDFEVWGAKLRGTHAAIDALLPLAAVAFGLSAIGIVFAVVAAMSQ
jgi:hypothetical protein